MISNEEEPSSPERTRSWCVPCYLYIFVLNFVAKACFFILDLVCKTRATATNSNFYIKPIKNQTPKMTNIHSMLSERYKK